MAILQECSLRFGGCKIISNLRGQEAGSMGRVNQPGLGWMDIDGSTLQRGRLFSRLEDRLSAFFDRFSLQYLFVLL
jgi:hypothetical protein